MASQNALRQVSRTAQNNRSHITPSRTRQYSSHTLFTSRPSHRIPSLHPRRQNAIQQTRNLSLWGSSKSTKDPTTPITNSDVFIRDPSDFTNPTSNPVRSVRASENVAADTSYTPSHLPNAHTPETLNSGLSALAPPPSDGASPSPALEQIPEGLGYLQNTCGLDFGYGPTTTMLHTLEHLHITAGLSWSASIIALGVLLRVAIFPLFIRSTIHTQRMREMTAVVKPMQAEMAEASRTGNQAKLGQIQMQMKAVKQTYGVKFSAMFAPMLVQFPLGFGAWRLLRNAAELPVPAFVTENWLWASDLTFSDPLYIMPVLAGALIYGTVKVNANTVKKLRTGVAAAAGGPDFTKIMGTVAPFLTGGFVLFQPGAVQLYFVSGSAAGLVSAVVLQNTSVRRFFGMPLPEAPAETPPQSQTPLLGSSGQGKIRGGQKEILGPLAGRSRSTSASTSTSMVRSASSSDAPTPKPTTPPATPLHHRQSMRTHDPRTTSRTTRSNRGTNEKGANDNIKSNNDNNNNTKSSLSSPPSPSPSPPSTDRSLIDRGYDRVAAKAASFRSGVSEFTEKYGGTKEDKAREKRERDDAVRQADRDERGERERRARNRAKGIVEGGGRG